MVPQNSARNAKSPRQAGQEDPCTGKTMNAVAMRGETAEPNRSVRPSDGFGRLGPRRWPRRERNDGAGPLIYGHLPTTGLSTDSRPEFGTNGHHITVTRTSIDETPGGIASWVVTTQRGRKTSGSAEPPLQVSAPTIDGDRKNGENWPDQFSRKDDSPALPKSAQRERSNSHSESRGRARRHERSANRNRRRSLSCDRAWTDVVSGGDKSEKDAKTRQRSSTPARKPQNDPLTAKMLQLESTIKLVQVSMRQQQETIRKQAEMITRLTSQQPRSGMQWNVSAPPTATLALSDATAMPPPPPPPQQGTDKTPRRKKARRSSVNESDEEEDLNMDNDADETASVSSISMLLSRTTEGQEGLNCGARFKKIYNRLNRQDRRINEISQKVDNVASIMNKFEARVEARITTGFEEMKLFMVQLLKEELSSLGIGNRNTPGSSLNHGQSN
ncbi:hypothetical protein MRX96_037873 [Rhipicephalus microplus]